MDLSSFLQRYKYWLLLAILLLLNVVRYWPAKHATAFGGGPPGGFGANGFPQPDAQMQARIDAMPEEQRTAFQTRMKADREFFDTLKTLPDAERQQKIQEHFAQNPPPFPPGGMQPGGPGVPGGSPPPGGPGGPGDGGGPGGGPGSGDAPRIPAPDGRRGMDQGLIDSMKNQQSQQQ